MNVKRFLLWLSIVSIGLFSSLPLLTDSRLPEAHDILFHLFRLVQLDRMIQQGVFFSRWAPEMVYGYGYPLFNYYAPLSYYVAEIPRLLGFQHTVALRMTFGLGFVGAAVAMYLWAREVLTHNGAIVAACAYALAPYVTVTFLLRGALAEHLALALLPFVMWAWLRFAKTRLLIYVWLSVLMYSAIILTHNVTALLFTPLLGVYSGILAWNYQEEFQDRSILCIQLCGWLALGLASTAFFWAPALLERDLVSTYQLYLPSIFDFATHFMTLKEIFAFPRPVDPLLVTQTPPLSLSVLVLLLACLGFSWAWIRSERGQKYRLHALFVGVGAALYIFMVLPASRVLWENLPMMHFLQFPWRFLGISTLLLGFLAGLGYEMLAGFFRPSRSLLLVIILTAAFAFYILPWQYVRHYPEMSNLSMRDAVTFERRSGLLGTTTGGEFLPATVHELPLDNNPALSGDGQHLDMSSLSESVQVLGSHYEPLYYSVHFESASSFVAVFHTFDFPGWQARIDGIRTAIVPTDPHGLISVVVPAGHHHLEVSFGLTRVRAYATGVSIGALLAMIGLSWFLYGRRARETSVADQASIEVEVESYSPIRVSSGIMLLLGLTAVLKLTCIDAPGRQTFLKKTRFDGQTVVGLDYPMLANFEHRLQLLGLDAPSKVQADATLDVVLYWRVLNSVKEEYSVGLMLVDGRGIRYAESDHQHPGDIPTRRWQPQEYAQDPYELRILPGTPPGTYTLQATVYPYGQPAQALDILNAQGAPVGRTATLAPLTVTRPQRPPTREQLAPQSTVNVPVTAGLHFIGYDMPETSQRAGDLLSLILYWEASQALNADLEIRFALRDVNGTLTSLAKVPPVVDYPTSQWVKGDRWRGVHRLLLPPTLDSGTYELVLIGPGSALLVLDTVTVEAPEHILEPPSVSQEQSAEFADLVSLVGYELSPPDSVVVGEALSVDLVWRVHRQTHRSYKTFVHLLDAEGRLVAGSDQVPGSWQRPSTGWIAGEYIVDVHTIAVPSDLLPGTYRLQAGLYDETSSTRLKRANGADTVVLDTPLNVEAP